MFVCVFLSQTSCLQSHSASVSRGVSQPEEPADLFNEEATAAQPNGVHSDDDDLFAGEQIKATNKNAVVLRPFSGSMLIKIAFSKTNKL